MNTRQTGGALLVGMVLLSLVTLLGLAAASGSHVERQLARNEQFRENAASAASAGVEIAISRILSAPAPATTAEFSVSLPGGPERVEVRTRLLGIEQGLPQPPEGWLVGAHIEILSTGHSLRGAVDHQRAIVMQVIESSGVIERAECEPAAPVRCLLPGELSRLSWQRVPPP